MAELPASAPHTAERPPYLITCDPARIDVDAVWGWLRGTYWAKNIPRDTVARAIRHSLPFGIFEGERAVGFARVVSDRATFAYVADVFVEEEARGRGLAVWLMEVIRAHPELQGLRRWMLATRDAHGLYAKSGFVAMAHPDWFMEIHRPDVYR
jgi:GNAT superfamily N-acetyltransferase